MNTFKVQSASARIFFHDLPGRGSPTLYIHGLGCASSCDYPAVASSGELAGRRALLVDLLGSGFSDRPDGFSYSILAQAHTLAELVRGTCDGPITIYGHSMGGAIAIVLATLLGSRVEKLALSEPNLDPRGGTFSRQIAAVPEAEYVARGHEAIIRAARADGNVVWASSMSQSAAAAVHRGAQSLVTGCAPTWREMLYGLRVPKTIIFGAQTLPVADFGLLPQQGVGVDVVPSAGHSMAWQNPAGLAAAVHRALH